MSAQFYVSAERNKNTHRTRIRAFGQKDSFTRRKGALDCHHKTVALRQFPLSELATETGRSGGRKESSGKAEGSRGTLSRLRFGRLHL